MHQEYQDFISAFLMAATIIWILWLWPRIFRRAKYEYPRMCTISILIPFLGWFAIDQVLREAGFSRKWLLAVAAPVLMMPTLPGDQDIKAWFQTLGYLAVTLKLAYSEWPAETKRLESERIFASILGKEGGK